MSEKELKRIEIPRRTYRLPASDVERLWEEVSRGLAGDGKASLTTFYPVNEREWVNEERMVTQLKINVTYCRKEIYFYERQRVKKTAKKTMVNCQCFIERAEWVEEGLLIVPHGSPYHENPDLLIVPEVEE
jgi:hypothetical protein